MIDMVRKKKKKLTKLKGEKERMAENTIVLVLNSLIIDIFSGSEIQIWQILVLSFILTYIGVKVAPKIKEWV